MTADQLRRIWEFVTHVVFPCGEPPEARDLKFPTAPPAPPENKEHETGDSNRAA